MHSLGISGSACLVSYLAGSIPFGLLLARIVAGIDIRQHGSGNIGATNVGRVLGARWGTLVLVLDCLKGMAPVALLPPLLLSEPCMHLPVLCGVSTILGHMFPCWLRFRGGKGVATALGVVLVLAPQSSLLAAGVFAVSFALWRIVSLSSILAALSFAIGQAVLLQEGLWSRNGWSMGVFSLGIPALIIYQHRSNLGRLLRGEEARFRAGSGKADAEAGSVVRTNQETTSEQDGVKAPRAD